MRVLQVINAFYPPYSGSGVAYVAHNISKALAGKGHEVTVYTTNALSMHASKVVALSLMEVEQYRAMGVPEARAHIVYESSWSYGRNPSCRVI